VNRVKGGGLSFGQPHDTRSDNAESSFLKKRDDLTALSGVESVGLDDGECSVACHVSFGPSA
jgi:hypothetical protein